MVDPQRLQLSYIERHRLYHRLGSCILISDRLKRVLVVNYHLPYLQAVGMTLPNLHLELGYQHLQLAHLLLALCQLALSPVLLMTHLCAQKFRLRL
jgi:hypothetical protein